MMLGYNCSASVNFGDEEFDYPPDVKEEYAPWEDSRIKVKWGEVEGKEECIALYRIENSGSGTTH